jgi:BNR/Asp-box repeat
MNTGTRWAALRWWSLAGIGALLLAFVVVPSGAVAQENALRQALRHGLRSAQFRTPAGIKRALPSISSGTLSAARSVLEQENGEERPFQDEREAAADAASGADTGVIGLDNDALGCNKRTNGNDVRVNQDCGFRRQAEEIIKVNPTNAKNLIAGQNDSRIGYNKCGFDYSFDGGKTWGDGIPPAFQRINDPKGGVNSIASDEGTGHTYDAGSDPALAFDSQGNAFFSCVLFDVASNASGLYVTRSPSAAGGSFYNNIPPTGASYMVVEDNSPVYFHDKNFITADSFPSSKFRDNVYVTWTLFKSNCGDDKASFCSSAIYFSKSTDHAKTWSKPQEISGSNPEVCFFGNFFDPNSDEHACNNDQGSDPIVLPDGTIAVIFNNGNTPEGNPNAQQLAVVSTDGGKTWSKPSKVGDDIASPAPLCDFGRGPEQCIPGAFIRTNDFPRIAVDKANGNLYAAWQDYRFGEYDIILSRSTDGGKTWKVSAKSVNPSKNRDHYFPAIDVGKSGKVAVSYYRTERIPNENTTPKDGFTPGRDPGVQALKSDYFLAGGKNLSTPFAHVRVANSFAPPDGVQAGFNGDYSGLIAIGDKAIPIWSDTRNKAITDQGVVHDEDVFIEVLDIPGD